MFYFYVLPKIFLQHSLAILCYSTYSAVDFIAEQF
jgi:hypothetical protein